MRHHVDRREVVFDDELARRRNVRDTERLREAVRVLARLEHQREVGRDGVGLARLELRTERVDLGVRTRGLLLCRAHGGGVLGLDALEARNPCLLATRMRSQVLRVTLLGRRRGLGVLLLAEHLAEPLRLGRHEVPDVGRRFSHGESSGLERRDLRRTLQHLEVEVVVDVEGRAENRGELFVATFEVVVHRGDLRQPRLGVEPPLFLLLGRLRAPVRIHGALCLADRCALHSHLSGSGPFCLTLHLCERSDEAATARHSSPRSVRFGQQPSDDGARNLSHPALPSDDLNHRTNGGEMADRRAGRLGRRWASALSSWACWSPSPAAAAERTPGRRDRAGPAGLAGGGCG